ncbi:MAG: squalene/phytoene synthase family protein [Alphaproteobacteria bacterium]
MKNKATKTSKDENFPVADFLTTPIYRPHIETFYRCVRTADDIADHPVLTPKEKMDKLELFEAILNGSTKDKTVFAEAYQHLESVCETNVSIEHALNLLQAFKLDVNKSRYRNWSELVNYCRYSAAPVGHYLLELHGESPDLRPHTDRLCISLQIINHLQDCKKDLIDLDRVYIPLDWIRKEGAAIESLDGKFLTPEMRKVIYSLLDRNRELVAAAYPGLFFIKNYRLRLTSLTILFIAKYLNHNLRNKDPIATDVKLTSIQKSLAVIVALFRSTPFF